MAAFEREPAHAERGPSERASDPIPTRWLVLSYLALSVVFFLPALLPGRMIFGTDYLAGAYFLEEFATERFAAGALPKWLPFVYGGVPFFANPMDVYYPISVLFRLARIPTQEHLGLLFVIQFFLAGYGTFLLVRELTARQIPAYISGILYMFSGYLISYVYAGHDGRAIVATLAPLFLFGLHRAIRRMSWGWFVFAGLILGSALLSFQIQTAYYLMLFAGLWFLFLIWHLELWRPLGALGRRVGGGLIVLTVAFSLAAVNFLPFLGYVDASPRGQGGRGYEYATSWSMPPEEIVGVAVPERSGLLDMYSGDNPFKLHTEYVGGLALVLFTGGLYLLRRSRYAWFFFGAGLFMLTVAFGGHTPLYRIYYLLLPGTSKFRAPSVSFYLITFSLCVLAGLALNQLASLRASLGSSAEAERQDASATLRTLAYLAAGAFGALVVWGLAVSATPPAGSSSVLSGGQGRGVGGPEHHQAYVLGIWRFVLFAALCVACLWAWLRRKVSDRIVAVLLAAVAIMDLWIIDKKFFETVPEPSALFAPDEIAGFLQSQSRPFRTFVLFDLPQHNYLTRFDIELVGGEHGNQLQSYNEFLGAGERTYTNFSNMAHPVFLALSNARYLVTGRSVQAPFLDSVFEGRTRSGRAATVYENRAFLPRAFLAASAKRVPDAASAIREMRAPGFDPRRTVLLYQEPPLVTTDGDLASGTARVVQHEPDRVVVEVATNQPAYLVLTDNYYPDWRAEVGGAPVEVLRANHTFRAIPVERGQHRVIFRFQPTSLTTGFLIYLSMWSLLIAYAVYLIVARRTSDRAS